MAKKAPRKATPARPETGKAMVEKKQPPGKLFHSNEFELIADPEIMEAINYNLQGEQIGEGDLDRIRVPAGGGTSWEVPDITGEVHSFRELEGIILHVGFRRAFWEDPNPNNSPPDCSSADGQSGVGNPGGDCMISPFNQFGSAIRQDGSPGRGKRCREMRSILFLRRDDRMPSVVIAPPASLKAVKQYMMRLPCMMFQAVTRLTLVQDKSADGIKYSRIQPAYLGSLPNHEIGQLKQFAGTLRRIMTASQPLPSDYDVTGADDSDGSSDPAYYGHDD